MADSSVAAPPGSAEDRLQDAKAAEHKITMQARKGGAAAFDFDPDAPPEEKAAQARKAIPPGLKLQAPGPKTISVTTDIGNNSVDANGALLPPAIKPPTNGTNGTNGSLKTPTSATSPKTPGYVNGYPKAGDGEWDRTGWEPRFGDLKEALGINDIVPADHQTWVESNLDDKFFGDWYHNAAVIIFACLSTWFLTLIGAGLGWVCIVMACCGTYYRTSIRRVRRNIRDDLNREFSKQRLDTDVESLEWMNIFTLKFWPIYQPVLAATIINTVDQVLAGATPAFLDSLRLSTFTLGTKPPRFEHIKTYPKTEDDIMEMDWKFSFNPNDVSDLTSRQLKNKVNPKVILEVRIGKGIASKGIPIIVEDMAFSGTMKMKIKLQINFPHVEKIDVCFMGRPTFDFSLKPLGGETFGIDIGFLPGLDGFIKEQIHGNLGPMFYAPNVFTLEIAKMLGGAPIDSAVGVLCVTIHNARGLKNSDKFSGAPDPYTVFSINNRAEVGRTKIVRETDNPKWNETKYLVITNFNDSLTMQVFDFNDIRKDKDLGIATFPLDKLQEDPEQLNVIVPVMYNGKARGQISADIRFFPVLEGRTLEDGTVEPPPETNTGIVRYTVSQAKDLDHTKSMVGQLSPYVIQLLNGHEINKSKPIKRNNNPIWEVSHEMLITNRKACKLGLVIKDDRDLGADQVLGTYNIKLDDLLETMAKGNEWFNLAEANTGRVKMTAVWKPVSMKGALGGTGGYNTPIGVMRLHFQNARELRNLEAVGKSDPYVRVLLSGVVKGRTVTFNNDLNPDWDEVLYVPVHSPKDKLSLEVMDHENRGNDRSLGAVELNCEEYIREDSNGLYMEHSERANRSDGLILGNKGSPKGTLNYTIAFYPCLNVQDPDEEQEEKKVQEIVQEEQKQEAAAEAEAKKPDSTKDALQLENEKVNTGEADKELAAQVSPTRSESGSEKSSRKKAPKIKLTPEELLKYDTGLMIFRIMEGQLAHKDCHLEVLMDDMLYPAYATSKIKTKTMKFDEIGDTFVRELEFSKVTLRLKERSKDPNAEDEVLAKLTGNTLETLKQCLNNPTVLTLKGKDDGEVNTIKISLKYIPVLMKLDPSESITNMGTLRVDILDAANLPSADRNGKSDPFCVFKVDDREVHKTKVQKKTLHPAWNEVFETKIASRTAANMIVEISDWDIGSKADFLGKTQIDLMALEPFTPQTFTYKLVGKQGEEGKFGELRLRMLFKPDYVTRSRQGSSTFHGTFATPGKIVTGVAGAPLKVGGFAAGGITKGASFLKKNTFGRVKKDSNGINEEPDPEMEELAKVPSKSSGGDNSGIQTPVESAGDANLLSPGSQTPKRRTSLSPARPFIGAGGGGSSPHNRNRSTSSTMTAPPVPGSAENGAATIRLMSATGFPPSANVQIRIKTADKMKDVHKSKSIKSASGDIEWDESVTFNCMADQQFKIFAKDNHLIRDEELGEGLFVVDDTGSGQDTVVSVGPGRVTLRTTFKSSEQGSTSSPTNRRRGLLKR